METNKKFGCLQLLCNVKNYLKIVKGIVDIEDIYDDIPGYSYSVNPHITLLYGFIPLTTMVKLISKYLYDIEPLRIYTQVIDYFVDLDFDVVKFNVTCKGLNIMNSRLKKNFQYLNLYPQYQPHMTIAYVKSGLGKKYAKRLLKKYRIRGGKYLYYVGNKRYKINMGR